jgi:hypothetical protein
MVVSRKAAVLGGAPAYGRLTPRRRPSWPSPSCRRSCPRPRATAVGPGQRHKNSTASSHVAKPSLLKSVRKALCPDAAQQPNLCTGYECSTQPYEA